MSSLVKLAEEILTAAKALEAHFKSNDLPDPTFDNDVVISVPLELQAERKTVVNKAEELGRLALGVQPFPGTIMSSKANEIAIRAIYRYKVANFVPLDGSCSYASLATETGLSEQLIRRFLRLCMSSYFFAQTPDGQVKHTVFSRRLATDPGFADGLGVVLEEVGPASSYAIEALKRYGESGEQTETAFSLLNLASQALAREDKGGDSPQTLFQMLGQDPERGRRFGAAMRYYSKGETQDLRHLLTGFDWKSIDNPDWVLIDVGGGHGNASQFLAQNTEKIQFVVQDAAETVQTGEKQLPVELQGRIQFEAHDFHQPQPRTGNVFFMRWILHNWSDKYAVGILKNLVPAMKEGCQLILYEYLIKDEPDTTVTERNGLNLDMMMLVAFSGIERTEENFRKILREADKRYVVEGLSRPAGGAMAVISVRWDPLA